MNYFTLKLAMWLKTNSSGLENQLVREQRTRWLDIGSRAFDQGFNCLDLGPLDGSKEHFSPRYFRKNILELTDKDFEELGQFDLVRMQHVLEHFSPEEAENVLAACAQLLRSGGYLIVSVPDLRHHVKAYLRGYTRFGDKPYKGYVTRLRIPEDAPASFVFSVFAHQSGHKLPQVLGDEHKWCYDYEGLAYQVTKVGGFRHIRRLPLFHPKAGIPFTHNRPAEDTCLLAERV